MLIFTAKVKLKKGKRGATKNNIKPVLEGELRSAAETLRSQSSNETKYVPFSESLSYYEIVCRKFPDFISCFIRCQAAERLVQSILEEGELGSEINSALASCLCVAFKDQLEGRIFPKDPNQE